MNIKTLIMVLLLSFSFCDIKENKIVYANEIKQVSEDEMVNKVIDMIASLPSTCTLEHEKDVKNCRNAYDNLLPSQKVLVTNLLDLLEKENQIALLYNEISYVVSLIDSLPNVDDFDLDQEKKLNEVIIKYNDLDNLQKDLVSNHYKLIELSNKLSSIYKSIEEIVILIDKLPHKDNIDNSTLILVNNIELLYNSLSDIQKNKISNFNKYIEIKEIINKINILIDTINNIPSKLSKDDLKLLKNIEHEYNTLTLNQKTLITNYSSFYTLYKGVLEAIEFNDLIYEFIPYLTLENKYLVEYLINKYNGFNDNEKVFIDNYEILIEISTNIIKEEEYYSNALIVIDLINSIPFELTLNDKEYISDIRKKYDSLIFEEKKYVDNYHLLLNAEAYIIKLENEESKKDIESLYNELDELINEVNLTLDNVKDKEKESEILIEEINNFLDELKKNEEKGLNKYLIIAIGLTSVFIIVAIIYIFSLNQSKINLDKEEI